MIILSGATAAISFGQAMLHMLWGLRIWWPIADETALAQTVAGYPGISAMMSPAFRFVVRLSWPAPLCSFSIWAAFSKRASDDRAVCGDRR